jgi:hypothetical protein
MDLAHDVRRVSFGVSSQSASTSPDIAIASMLSNARPAEGRDCAPFRDARAPLDRAAVDTADADIAHTDHGL